MGGTWLLHCDRMPHSWIMECLFTSWGLHLYALIKFSFYSIKFLYFCMLISKYINILWFLNSCYKWLAIFNYFLIIKILLWGFPGGSDGEESAMMKFQLSYFKSWKMMLWKCYTQYASKFEKLIVVISSAAGSGPVSLTGEPGYQWRGRGQGAPGHGDLWKKSWCFLWSPPRAGRRPPRRTCFSLPSAPQGPGNCCPKR